MLTERQVTSSFDLRGEQHRIVRRRYVTQREVILDTTAVPPNEEEPRV